MKFSPEQQLAINAPLEPGLILAGAGTGKTTVMVERVCQLVSSGQLQPEQILGLTFTNKAAGEFKERTIKRLKQLESYSADPDISTYHSFAQSLLTNHGLRIGVDANSPTLSDSARAHFAYQVIKKTKLDLPYTPDGLNSVVNKVIKLDNELAEHDIEVNELIEQSTDFANSVKAVGGKQAILAMAEVSLYRTDLARLVQEFRDAKKELQVIDFADQLRFALKIVREHQQVREQLRDTYRAVLLDEYQDTSVTQRILMTEIFGDGHPVTAVGDPLQAIYGWRGAAVSNIEQFKNHFKKSDGTSANIYFLSTNYRSGSKILAMANQISEKLKSDLTHDHELVADAELAEKAQVKLKLTHRSKDEIDSIIDQINELKNHTPLSDIAILARNSTVLQELYTALNLHKIPASFAGTRDLLKVPEVIELLSYLKVIEDPSHNPSFIRILSGPRFQISLRDIALLAKAAQQITKSERVDLSDADLSAWLTEAVSGTDLAELALIGEAVEEPGNQPYGVGVKEKLNKLAAELNNLRKFQSEPLPDFIYRVLLQTNLLNELKIKTSENLAAGQQAIDEMLSLASHFSIAREAGSLAEFLNWLETSEELSEPLNYKIMPSKNSVTLITVHSAKGLEWPVVFLPFTVEGVFPNKRTDAWIKRAELLPAWIRQDGDTLKQLNSFSSKEFDSYEDDLKQAQQLEERRLMYVAITRCKEQLFVSGHNWGNTQSKVREVSPFLRELKNIAELGNGEILEWYVADEEESNPNLLTTTSYPWPRKIDQTVFEKTANAAQLVRSAAGFNESELKLTDDEEKLLENWDKSIASLISEIIEQTNPVKKVMVPINLNVTRTIEMSTNQDRFAERLLRPIPNAPFVETRRGTQFHLWVENYYKHPTLLDPFDLPGGEGDRALTDEELKVMQQNFLASNWANLKPLALEWDFDLKIADRYVRGRIDAIFEIEGRIMIVDWKTGKKENSNDLQLAIYKAAYAERKFVDLEKIDAAFVYLPSLEQHQPNKLPNLAEIEQLLLNA
jgi:DNA helicase-2/ATP-dependent DNA helicase PcrA